MVALVSVDPAGPERTVQEYVSGSPSGSEAVPERTCATPTVTVLSAPAFAVGARLVVESTTLSEPLNEPLSVAVSRNVYVPAAFAVNEGDSVVALVSVDPAGPERTVQEYVSGSPSGSEAVPERTCATPTVTVLSAPAFAVGARLLVESTTLSEPLNEPLSVAVSRNVYVPAAAARERWGQGGCVGQRRPRGTRDHCPWYVIGSPSGSEAVPESVYGVPMVTLLSAPAFAVGARFVVESTTLSEPLNEPLSVAVSRNVYVPALFAVNEGVKVVALVSVDPAGPATTAQEYVSGSPSGSEAVPGEDVAHPHCQPCCPHPRSPSGHGWSWRAPRCPSRSTSRCPSPSAARCTCRRRQP